MVFVDSRIELPDQDLWRRFYDIEQAVGWREAFSEYDVRAVIPDFRKDVPLIQALRDAPDWDCETSDTAGSFGCFRVSRPNK